MGPARLATSSTFAVRRCSARPVLCHQHTTHSLHECAAKPRAALSLDFPYPFLTVAPDHASSFQLCQLPPRRVRRHPYLGHDPRIRPVALPQEQAQDEQSAQVVYAVNW